MLYLDTAATTPVDRQVADVVLGHMVDEFGNAGSRTHEWGARAKRALQAARASLADAAGCEPDEVVFTSGATESNNLALLGLASYGRESGRRHILTSATEHKAVLEPLQHLATAGFDVEFMNPGTTGRFSVDSVMERVRTDTLIVSLMHVNNETGVIQPISELADELRQTPTLLHVDAAQGFAKIEDGAVRSPVDMVSISGHKLGAPKGIGALVVRRRGWSRAPLEPLMFGGGQERKLRPGTVPVALAVGLAKAAELMVARSSEWVRGTRSFRAELLSTIEGIPHQINGDAEHSAPHILNVSFEGIDSEALVLACRDVAAIATGSACTSASYTPSHVLTAMGLPDARVAESVRLSWWSDTDVSELIKLREVLVGLAA